jgi:hypothetical protein
MTSCRHPRSRRSTCERCYTRPVRCPENRAAHGGVCVVEVCGACAAERRTNINGTHVERGSWSRSDADRSAATSRDVEAEKRSAAQARDDLDDALRRRPAPLDVAGTTVRIGDDGMIALGRRDASVDDGALVAALPAPWLTAAASIRRAHLELCTYVRSQDGVMS